MLKVQLVEIGQIVILSFPRHAACFSRVRSPDPLSFCPPQEAERIFSELQRLGLQPDIRTYTVLIEAYGRCGQPKRAEEVLKRLQSSGCVPDTLVYAILVRSFATSGKFELALEYYERVKAEVEDAEGGGVVSPLCKQIVEEFRDQYVSLMP